MILMLRAAFFLSFAMISLAQTAPPQVGTASISGKITIEGKPAAGVVVLFYKDNERHNRSKPPNSATADAAGVYKLEKLVEGNYYVSVSAPGYYDPQKRTEWDYGLQVNLTEGEQVSNIDFALVRGAVVTGRLMDEQGRAVIGEQVVLVKQGANGQKQTVNCSDSSDDRGVYRCYGLEPGKYLVGAGASSQDSMGRMDGGRAYKRTWHPNVTEEERAKVLEVTVAKETTDIDIRLERMKKGYKVLGKFIDANTGKPLPNMMLLIGRVNEAGVLLGMSFVDGSISNAEGEFKIEGLMPGKYLGEPRGMQGGEMYGDSVRFEIGSEEVTSLEVKMEKGATITGTAVLEDGANPDSQRQFSSLHLMAYAKDPKAKDGDWFSTTSSFSAIDAAGNVSFKGLRTGKVFFRVASNNHKGFSIARIEHNGAPVNDGLEVRAGEQFTGLRIVLAYGSATIRGEIKVEGGTLPEDMRLGIRVKMKNGDETFAPVDARKRFLIEGLSAGSYDLIVDAFTNRPPFDKPTVTLEPNTKTVQVTNGQETVVELTVRLGSKEVK